MLNCLLYICVKLLKTTERLELGELESAMEWPLQLYRESVLEILKMTG